MLRTIKRLGTWVLRGQTTRVAGQFLFLHIAKTAGTSFTAVLEAQFAPWRVNRAYELPAFLDEAARTLDRYRLVRGHFVYTLVERFRVPPHVIVMLRDPFARTLSHLRHMQREPHFWLRAQVPLGEMKLGEILADERVAQIVQDYQTRILGHDYELAEMSLQTMADVPSADEAMLRRAMERLEGCAFVGLTEQFEESLALLCRTFGWRNRGTVPYLNITPNGWHPDEVDEELRTRVADITAYDDRLYAHAFNLFEERLAQLGDTGSGR